MRCLLLCLAAVVIVPSATADIRSTDDGGRELRLSQPAKRIVSLAPHVTELLFAAGAGGQVVAAVEYSDFPSAAARLPRVGSGHSLDLEGIVAMRPDLILAWESGNPPRQVERLRALGLKVFALEIRALSDVPAALERVGMLAGTESHASVVARQLRERLAALEQRYRGREDIKVFYQLLDESLMTVNGQHLISDVLGRCGASNVFGDMALLVARVDTEAVLAVRPQAIIAGGEDSQWRTWRAHWQRQKGIPAVEAGALYFIPADLMHRPGPRVFDAAETVCAQLDAARSRYAP